MISRDTISDFVGMLGLGTLEDELLDRLDRARRAMRNGKARMRAAGLFIVPWIAIASFAVVAFVVATRRKRQLLAPAASAEPPPADSTQPEQQPEPATVP